MSTLLMHNAMVSPTIPTSTSDVVRVVRLCVASLAHSGINLAQNQSLVEYVVSRICDGLQAFGAGVRLGMLCRTELTEPPPSLRVQLRLVPYGSANGGVDFESVDAASEKLLQPDLGSNERIENRITLIASVILTNSDDASGQPSHPLGIRKELQKIEDVCASIDSQDQIRFLEALETACLRAHRAGGTIAAVAIRDSVDGMSRSVEFEPFFADSEDLFRAEEVRRRQESQRCVSIVVRQHDTPR